MLNGEGCGAALVCGLAPIEMGAGIAASPHCAERRICRCLKSRTRRLVSQVLAHQLRRRIPSSKRPQGISAMFRGPSWDDHSCVPLCIPRSEDRFMPRRAGGKIISSGASSRLAPKHSEEHLIACRRRSVLPSPAASFLPLPAFRWRRGLPSRSLGYNARRGRVAKAKNVSQNLWITGISGTTVGT